MNKLVNDLNENIKPSNTHGTLEHLISKFKDGIIFTSSLSIEDQVITHMVSRFSKQIKVVVLDTGRLHEETYQLIDKSRDFFRIDYSIYYPDASEIESFTKNNGINSFYKSTKLRHKCCEIRKINPLKRALANCDLWVTGIRREHSSNRSSLKYFEFDEKFQCIKFNPILDWSTEKVWDHVKKHNLPYNPLYNKNFSSIGCQPCTRAIKPGEDIRAGRWWWESSEKKECGLHFENGQVKRVKENG
jgi:phosphoadenosine phosphosulfate reductase